MCKLPYARLQECKIARNEFMMIKELSGKNRLVFGNKWLLLRNNRLVLEDK